jgi:hypothetical protein
MKLRSKAVKAAVRFRGRFGTSGHSVVLPLVIRINCVSVLEKEDGNCI